MIKISLVQSLGIWVIYLPEEELALTNSPHKTTKEYPHYLNYFRYTITLVIANDPILITLLKATLVAPERAEQYQKIVGKFRRAAMRMHGLLA